MSVIGVRILNFILTEGIMRDTKTHESTVDIGRNEDWRKGWDSNPR
jgi:hypothetical protein